MVFFFSLLTFNIQWVSSHTAMANDRLLIFLNQLKDPLDQRLGSHGAFRFFFLMLQVIWWSCRLHAFTIFFFFYFRNFGVNCSLGHVPWHCSAVHGLQLASDRFLGFANIRVFPQLHTRDVRKRVLLIGNKPCRPQTNGGPQSKKKLANQASQIVHWVGHCPRVSQPVDVGPFFIFIFKKMISFWATPFWLLIQTRTMLET